MVCLRAFADTSMSIPAAESISPHDEWKVCSSTSGVMNAAKTLSERTENGGLRTPDSHIIRSPSYLQISSLYTGLAITLPLGIERTISLHRYALRKHLAAWRKEWQHDEANAHASMKVLDSRAMTDDRWFREHIQILIRPWKWSIHRQWSRQ